MEPFVVWAVNFSILKEMDGLCFFLKSDRCNLLKTNQMQYSSKDNTIC